MKPAFDVAIVGGGPSGATCAAICAQGGLRTVVLERARFPREKVCGDCLNPLALPILRGLGLEARVKTVAHARLREVEFIGCAKQRVLIALPEGENAELGVKRSLLDELLLNRAAELGAEVRQETTLTALRRQADGWELITGNGRLTADAVIAADGRNSTVARLLNLLPPAQKDRVGLQTHFALPNDLSGRVRMQFVRQGYSGIADVGGGIANLCLVARPPQIEAIRNWANTRYGLPDGHPWRSITPLTRAPISPLHDRLLLVGDVARVVEPFTGEGIAYAILTGAAAARALLSGHHSQYALDHRAIYSGRLWVNHLARFACLHPYWATAIVGLGQMFPGVLSSLTRKVICPLGR